jgi:hypothetical protein
MNLADWLLEQIAADEAVAQAATPGPWVWRESRQGHDDLMLESATAREPDPLGLGRGDFPVVVVRAIYDGGVPGVDIDQSDAAHIAHWDPARVLAECAAKRRIVAHHTPAYDPRGLKPRDVCLHPSDNPCPTLRLLAQPYRDRDGYRQEWDVQ